MVQAHMDALGAGLDCPPVPAGFSLGPLAQEVRRRSYFGYYFGYYFANFWRARSRLFQNEILQENTSMRLTAFFKNYKMCTLLHRSILHSLAKNRLKKSAINCS